MIAADSHGYTRNAKAAHAKTHSGISPRSLRLGGSILCVLVPLCLTAFSQRIAVLTTAHFAIYSDFETNLNDTLIAAGLARKKNQPELFRSGPEAPCFEKLPPSTRAAWDRAVDYYAESISPVSFGSREQFLIRMQLAGFEQEWRTDESSIEFVEIARGFRAAAAPAYKACRWTVQDAQNRKWIAQLKPSLAVHEEKLTSQLQQTYKKQWKTLPILVDVVEVVDWSGANTGWPDSGQGHVLISNTVGGAAGFETLFHEASHVLMDRSDPMRAALDRAAKAADFHPPNDLWHVVLFYTTGEIVRRALEEGYSPMLYEIYKKGGWVEFREPLEKNWRSYIDGKSSLDEAAQNLIQTLKTQKPQ